jgi:multiple sugar transport system permease protein
MPILSPIGRRSYGVRLLLGAIYGLLIAGALTMVYPFLLLIAGSTKSAVDAPDTRLVPRFLVDRSALYQKYVEGLFNESMGLMQSTYDSAAPRFALVTEPEQAPAAFLDAWLTFLQTEAFSTHAYGLGFVRAVATKGVQPYFLRRWKNELYAHNDGRLDRLNAQLQTAFPDWGSLDVRAEDFLVRRSTSGQHPFTQAYHVFKQQQPVEMRYYFNVEGFYRRGYLMNRYTRDLAAYNAAHATTYTSWDEVICPLSYPTRGTTIEQEDWETFVRIILHPQWVQVDDSARTHYQVFLSAKYRTLEALNRAYGTSYRAFTQALPPSPNQMHGLVGSDWIALLRGWRNPDDDALHAIPLDAFQIRSVDQRFRDWLAATQGTLPALNAALGTDFRDWSQVKAPQQAAHHRYFLAHQREVRWEFATRNVVTVWDYIVRRGRGVVNTVVYCLLAVLAALIVNPLAAYALSRYRPPSAYKVLLFLMLTMAFPPMVTQIPAFLLLRRFDLLNTFWALLLPGLANGYSIFLLKGFFDSLPRELYESAEMDGAGEFRIFWQITMSLSQPILAVIALNAFTHAYSNFMFALLICQDQQMWTLMPWLYQLQQRSGPGVIYASLLIAALPTFVIFALCQNVIMRGIVVPVEK